MSSRRIATCDINDDVHNAMSAMQAEKVRRIPIVDERRSLVGIVDRAQNAQP